MNDIHAWLDHRKIEPVWFKPIAKADSGVGFEITFNGEDERRTFSRRPFEHETSHRRRLNLAAR